MVKMEAEARRKKEKLEHEHQREDRLRETEVKTMKKSLKRAQKKARQKMAIKLDKIQKLNPSGIQKPVEHLAESCSELQTEVEKREIEPPQMLGSFAKRRHEAAKEREVNCQEEAKAEELDPLEQLAQNHLQQKSYAEVLSKKRGLPRLVAEGNTESGLVNQIEDVVAVAGNTRPRKGSDDAALDEIVNF